MGGDKAQLEHTWICSDIRVQVESQGPRCSGGPRRPLQFNILLYNLAATVMIYYSFLVLFRVDWAQLGGLAQLCLHGVLVR